MQHESPASYRRRRVHLQVPMTTPLEDEPQERLRTGVRPVPYPVECPRPVSCTLRAANLIRRIRQLGELGQRLPVARADQMVAGSDEVLPVENTRELTPHQGRLTDRPTVQDVAADAAQTVTDDPATARGDLGKRDSYVKLAHVERRGQGHPEEDGGGLVAEVRLLRHHCEICIAELGHRRRGGQGVHAVEGMPQITCP